MLVQLDIPEALRPGITKWLHTFNASQGLDLTLEELLVQQLAEHAAAEELAVAEREGQAAATDFHKAELRKSRQAILDRYGVPSLPLPPP